MSANANEMTYPLKFRPVILDKVWGGRNLEAILGKPLPGKKPIGEIWTVWENLAITNGPRRGHRLKDLTSQAPQTWLGRDPDAAASAFPLLVKLLDAQENLSVQVHPDDDYAQRNEDQPFGKCEMWYVLSARPGAGVIHGPRVPLSPSELRTAIQSGTLVDALEWVEVKPGDVLLNQPGTIHALGAGVVIYELQQSCDLTYRLYDWDRGSNGGSRRELHVDRGVAVSDLRPLATHVIEPLRIADADGDREILCATRYFIAELLQPRTERLTLHVRAGFELLTVLDGRIRVAGQQSPAHRAELGPGESVLLPATGGDCTVIVIAAPVRLIRAYVPNLTVDVIEPLLTQGIDPETISQLGGDPARSDVRAALDRRTQSAPA